MKEIEQVFETYLEQYDLEDDKLKQKRLHSYRVMELSKNIAESLHLSEEDIYLAQIIGLLHDIGRFEQLHIYHSYHDSYLDHGKYGANYLKESDFLSRLPIPHSFYPIIISAVSNHNQVAIEESFDERTKLHAKIIRDADKIDIFRSIIKKPSNLVTLSVTKEVETDFYKEKPIDIDKVKTNMDFVLVRLSFVYDMNFLYTFQEISKEQLLEHYYQSLTHQDIIKPYYSFVKEYLRKKLEEESLC